MERTLGIAGLALLATTMFAESALAKNIAVGPITCEPQIKPINRFTTIKAAVAAALTGDVVLVCPGSYPEQVVIDKSITLKGTADPSGGNLAVITRGAEPLNLYYSAHYANVEGVAYMVAPQVLVQGAAAAYFKVLNLAVDGGFEPHSSQPCPPGAAAYRSVGIFVLDVGTAVDGPAGGTIGNLSVRNQYADACPGPPKGVGVLTENSYISVLDSNVHSIIGDGVVQRGGLAFIQRNFFMDVTDYSVKLYNAVDSDVRTNTIIHSGEGVTVQLSTGADVVGNTIGPYVGSGIHLAGATSTLVSSNRMVFNTIGIEVNESNNSSVTGNIVQRSGTGIRDLFSGSANLLPPNAFRNNEVNEANLGICTFAPGSDFLTPNTFTNVVVATATCP